MKLRLTAALVVALCTLVGVALAGQVPLVADSSIPAAAGNIDYLHDKNHNIKYHLETKHLARPDSLTPAKNSYVVWVQPRGKDPVNAGVLTVNDQLVGSFRGTTPYQTFDVFITAEDSPSVDHPSGTQLMKATVQAQPE